MSKKRPPRVDPDEVRPRIQKQSFNCVGSFINALRPSAEPWKLSASYDSKWLFRGVGSEEYRLIPSLWRTNADGESNRLYRPLSDAYQEAMAFNHENATSEYPGENPAGLVEAVYRNVIERFQEFGYEHGLLAERRDTNQLVRALSQGKVVNAFERMAGDHCPRWFEVLILAQHYGIPTPLLDVTLSGLYAAYFAAKSVPEESETLHVYAIEKLTLKHAGVSVFMSGEAFNDHIRRQRGRVLFWHGLHPLGKNGLPCCLADGSPDENYESLIDHVMRSYSHNIFTRDLDPAIYDFQLPAEKSRELLATLRSEGISQTAMMPNLASCADDAMTAI